MIYVTQGSEKGIGLEVFIKSILSVNIPDLTLVCFKDSLLFSLNSLKLNFKISNNILEVNNKKISFIEPDFIDSQTLSCLLWVFKNIKNEDYLLTLPSSKDQFTYQGINYLGHTEFFRFYFKKQVSMLFKNNKYNCLLITDHHPLSKISTLITSKLIIDNISNVISKYSNLKNIFISGLNPHSGENGLLGTEENIIIKAIDELKQIYKNFNFFGPLAADTIYKYFERDNLIVYMYHDQALGTFKSLNGFNGANITLGLPFNRISVDFGTACELFGKDSANYLGLIKILNEIKEGTL